jgi:hypothetical protein
MFGDKKTRFDDDGIYYSYVKRSDIRRLVRGTERFLQGLNPFEKPHFIPNPIRKIGYMVLNELDTLGALMDPEQHVPFSTEATDSFRPDPRDE